ncbi:hypothetical protein SDC9_166610 [bioreactor metagenome]|uniref:Uncharacterized protein n=1 Tax=bioreactor metagenome TaxID=1076179 RepID=A0A645G5F9_9ZZZZ
MAHQAVVLNAAAVVGQGDHAGAFQGADRRHFHTFEAFGHAAGGQHLDHAALLGAAAQIFDRPGGVGGGAGVGHGHNRGKAARGGGHGAGGDGFRGRIARLPEMDVQINESRRHHPALEVDHFRIAQRSGIGHMPVAYAQVAHRVDVAHRIDQTAIFQQIFLHDTIPVLP